MTLDLALSNAIAYLMYTMTLALALQVGIEQLKPFIITPLREALKISDTDYIAFMYVVRAFVTIVAYLWIWGGVSATRLAVPFLAFVPDIPLGVVTVLVVIGGTSVINDLTDRLRALKEAAEVIKLPAPPAPPVVDAQTAKDFYRAKDR
jgi:fatty acid desaturase